jgi:hypothetical protein
MTTETKRYVLIEFDEDGDYSFVKGYDHQPTDAEMTKAVVDWIKDAGFGAARSYILLEEIGRAGFAIKWPQPKKEKEEAKKEKEPFYKASAAELTRPLYGDVFPPRRLEDKRERFFGC